MLGIVPRTIQAGWRGLLPVFPCLFSVLLFGLSDEPAYAVELSGLQAGHSRDFSARLTWHAGGKTSRAQLFAKGDRYRIEHRGGIKTNLGYATVTIVRLDQQCVWYVLSQRRLVVEVPLILDDVLPLSVTLEGEALRRKIGDALVGDQEAVLYEVAVEHHDRREMYYEWVDEPRQLLLKLVSQNRDWSVAYDRVILSRQPEYFFEIPLGYRKVQAARKQAGEG